MRFKRSYEIKDLLLLSLIIGLAYFVFLGFPPLYIPDEGRYAEIPREMLATHQFILPRLDGVLYFEKPPLIYWLTAFFEYSFGYNEWAVRGINSLMALLTCLSVYLFANRFYDRRTGYFAALTLASSLLFFGIGHLLTLDMGVTFFLSLCLLFFYAGLQNKKAWQIYAAYTAAALMVLTKGLIGIIFPASIIGLWIVITQQWKVFKHARLITGFLLLFLIALPWHVLAQERVPSFFHEYIIVQQFLRFLTPIMSRHMGFFTYCLVFILSFFPWVIFTVLRLKALLPHLKKLKKYQLEWFFIAWIVAIFLFFAPSKSILIPYLQPLTPAFALLTAPYFSERWKKGSQKFKKGIIALIIGMFVILNTAWVLGPYVSDRSTKTLALDTRALLQTHPNAVLINYDYYYQDFPFYTHHLVLIANWQNELSYGFETEPQAHNIIIDDTQFWNLMNSDQAVYVVTAQNIYETLQKSHPENIHFINQENKYVLFSNTTGASP